MGRPTSKTDLIESANTNYQKLMNLINSMSEVELSTEFDFSDDVKKKELHWKRDKNVKDILIHLFEWHQLLLNWVESNMKGNKSHFLPKPYTWKTYGEMNIEIWKKHQITELDNSKKMLQESHTKVMSMIETFSNEQLFTKKAFDWTGTTTLGSYCVSATSSHYDWAMKKIRSHIRKIKNM